MTTTETPERMFTFSGSSEPPAFRVRCHNCDWTAEGDDAGTYALADEHDCLTAAGGPVGDDREVRDAND